MRRAASLKRAVDSVLSQTGVDLDTIGSFLDAGACAVGLGSALVEKEAVARGDMDRVKSLAEQYVAAVRHSRS